MRPNEKTWADASKKWLEETCDKKDHKNDVSKLRWIGAFWNEVSLSEIDREAIQALVKKKKGKVKPATVNRYLALIRAILRCSCDEWQWLDRVPRIRMLKELSRRIRWLTSDQAKRLLDELPEHQRHAAIFALSTGLRAGNVLGLKWDQIDFKRRFCYFDSSEVKNDEELFIALNDSALSVLRARRSMHNEYVFTYKGKRIGRLNTAAWKKALNRAGIENFRWHDLRHTWASWLVQEGVPLYALQEMGGWKSSSMVRRYAHLSFENTLQYSRILDTRFNVLIV